MAGLTSTGNTPQRSDGLAASAPAGVSEDVTNRSGDDGEGNVSPEEQQIYERFVTNGLSMIYSREALPRVLELLQGDGQPKEGLANAAAMVVMRLEDSAREAGRDIPPDVLFQGGVEILEDLANLAGEAGIHDFSEDEIEGALYQALDTYRDMRGDSLDRQAIEQDFDALVRADRQGQIGRILPQLEGRATSAASGGGEQAPRGGLLGRERG